VADFIVVPHIGMEKKTVFTDAAYREVRVRAKMANETIPRAINKILWHFLCFSCFRKHILFVALVITLRNIPDANHVK
jgi:hypothetical protein